MLQRDTTEPQMLDELDVQTWHSVYWAEIERRIGSIWGLSRIGTGSSINGNT